MDFQIENHPRLSFFNPISRYLPSAGARTEAKLLPMLTHLENKARLLSTAEHLDS